MPGRITNRDIKSESELSALGAPASELPNDDKVYLSALSLNKTLKQAIIDGDLSGGGGSADFNKILTTVTGEVLVSAISGNVLTKA